MSTEDHKLEPALARRMGAGLGLIALLGASVAGWAATTPIAGAVIASGLVVVDSNIKKVQHGTGGVVSSIRVKNGDTVKGGDIVVTLDETQAGANLGVVVSQLVQLIGRKARLEAERDDAASLKFPAGFDTLAPDAPDIAAGERRLFEKRRTARLGQVPQLRERVGQLRQGVKGLTAQQDAKQIELTLMQDELDRLEIMRKKDPGPATPILASQ